MRRRGIAGATIATVTLCTTVPLFAQESRLVALVEAYIQKYPADKQLTFMKKLAEVLPLRAKQTYGNQPEKMKVFAPLVMYLRDEIKRREGMFSIQSSSSEIIDTTVQITPNMKDFLVYVNTIRKSNSLPAFTYNDSLNKAARQHAEYISSTQHFSHVTDQWEQVRNRAEKYWYRYVLIAENLAEWYSTASSLIDSRMTSEIHKQNILHPHMVEIGVSYIQTTGTWVVVFGRQE